MIKRGKITILDTGFNTSDRDGTANSGTNKASLATYRCKDPNGNAITLNCNPIRRRSGTNLSDEPNPSSNDIARVHFTTFSNAIYEIDFIINARDETERNLLKEIVLLERTNGVKLLYNSDTSDVTKTLPEIIGRTDTKFHGSGKELTNSEPAIVGRVIGTQLNNFATSIKFSITGTITFEEEKVITA